jgi:DNA repair exonuclease SbcCD ATPase subunit
MIEELNKIKYKFETLQKHLIDTESKLDNLNQQNIDLNNELAEILEEREYYKKAVDVVYERSIKELKDLLNSALHAIFIDRDFEVDIELSDKRGKSIQLKALENGRPVNLKRGTGMGVKTVISAILHMYYLQCKNSKILMLDEKYSAVSEEYVPAFFEFLSQLCQKLGFKIILITHDKRFLDYADKKYKINQGEVYSV